MPDEKNDLEILKTIPLLNECMFFDLFMRGRKPKTTLKHLDMMCDVIETFIRDIKGKAGVHPPTTTQMKDFIKVVLLLHRIREIYLKWEK